MLASAFGLRLFGITEPSIEQRETQSGLLARRWHVDAAELPAWQQQVLAATKEEIKPIEPPILDVVSATAFRVLGEENFWFPRAVSSLLWVAGGIFLYLIARRLTSTAGALVALLLYLVWPYGVWHSRLFMPDAFLVLALLAAVLTVIRYWEQPTPRRFAAAAAVSSFATLVKPGVAFLFLVALFGALATSRGRLRSALLGGRLPLFAGLAGAAAGVYTLWGAYLTDFIWEGADDSRLAPDLLASSAFWNGWWDVVAFLLTFPLPQQTLAIVPLVAGGIGIVLAPKGTPRAVLGGLAVGYLAFAVAWAPYTHTHPYYSLALIPLLALAIGTFADRVLRRLEGTRAAGYAAATVVVAVGAVAVQKAHWALTQPPPLETIADYRRVGELTDHTTRAIILDPELGTPSMYWGWIVGESWDLSERSGVPDFVADADYLVVLEDLGPLEAPAVKSVVDGRPVVAKTDRFAIFDLRGRS